jgi:hypothetical protein
MGSDDVDLDAYVTNKALDGLFAMVAEEEKHIRQKSVARTTDLMRQVFGGQKLIEKEGTDSLRAFTRGEWRFWGGGREVR